MTDTTSTTSRAFGAQLLAAAGLHDLSEEETQSLTALHARFQRDRLLIAAQSLGNAEPAVQFNPASRLKDVTDE